ncbi:protein LOW PSII ACCUMULATION 1, chloroplastic isoform X1 [Iris pallida]|uniref:Protein LOW PSII ACCUMULATION 1, chloroplastic isoform X1 n=2 Tax=Iris pallida TaxID=29817 RepID=A0AAX6DRY0_IRIPA|nr:protein LOW PSII ACCUMULATION 1, chloroplastic isoform X1 [Iris pallida]KAJ6843099.1 protein LOW PSII ACCUMULATION 1, chloroplastic isoform X1 [Iris pallida]
MATTSLTASIPFLIPSIPNSLFPRTTIPLLLLRSSSSRRRTTKPNCNPTVCFSSANKPSSSSSSEISSAAKIRSEVLSPFRSVRMFFYVAFIASAGLGTLITIPRLISTLANSSRSSELPDVLIGLGIDVGAVLIFAFLYVRENNAKNVQISRLSREERLSNLKLRVNENKIISVNSLRGIARLVILAGPASFIKESFERSKSFSEGLIERGILVVPFATDGEPLDLDIEESGEEATVTDRKRRLWQLSPVLTSEWAKWIDEQKKLAKVAPDSPVYLSLRMDGRVRGSGVGYPPWNAFVAQLPPVKGIWLGLLDGMDGRVL